MESDFTRGGTPAGPTVTNGHAIDNAGDRRNGEQWERAFCQLAARFGKVFSPHQIASPGKSAAAYGRGIDGRWEHYTLPDVTIWSAPGEHHEIKNKRPDRDGAYGLERYRIDALVRWADTTGQRVYYTIHDWEAAGGASARDASMPNDISHWFYADIAALSQRNTRVQKKGRSYISGKTRNDVEICYWTACRYFRPLSELWTPSKKTT